jgi:threonylcarbamoyladenosine tRNA methylthiotransferase MtaB
MTEPGRRQRCAFITLGCKANRYDTAAMMAMVPAGRYEVVEPDAAGPVVADVYVINTCAVTGSSAFQSRQMARRVKRWNPEARVVITGCLAELEAEKLRAAGADLVAGVGAREEVVRFLGGDAAGAPVFFHPAGGSQGRVRAVVKVQDGCDFRCAYCIVSVARGPSRSLAPAAVLGQLSALAARGFQEAVLTGIHLGLYGRDRGSSLAELLRMIEAAPDTPPRIRVSSLDPQELTPELIGIMASSSKICPHLHLPLQSGDRDTLSRMRRPYTPEEFETTVSRAPAAMPAVAIGLDLIAGFPGESEAAHDNTRSLIERLAVAYLHVFPFSRRPGTVAAAMEGQVAPGVIKQRARELRELGAAKKQAFLAAQVGRTLEVLAESREGGMVTGTSGNYARVRFPAAEEVIGKIVMVRVEKARAGHVEGSMVDGEGDRD